MASKILPWNELSIALMKRIIEWAKQGIPIGNTRHQLYCHLIDEFEQHECYNLEECKDLDEHFATAWNEMHSWGETKEKE